MQSKRKSFSFSAAARRSHWHASAAGMPPVARRWLATEGSLTAAVRALSPQFAVRRTFEGWRPPLADEAALLGRRRNRQAWTREVLLCDGTMPLVFAHTVAARQALPAWPWLRGLGDRALGEVLFQHHGVRRQPLEFRRLDARHPLYQLAARHLQAAPQPVAPHLFARRSVFVLHGKRLLVTEVFLPELLER